MRCLLLSSPQNPRLIQHRKALLPALYMDEHFTQLSLCVRRETLPCGGRESTLRLIAEEAASRVSGLRAGESVFADALKRELTDPTYIGMGLAVPHARVRGLHQACIYMAYSPAGIPWPHEAAHFVALLIVPWEAPEMHLQLLARLVRWRKELVEEEEEALIKSPDKLSRVLGDVFIDMM